MAYKPANTRKSKKPGGSRYAALAILTLIILAVGAYLVNRSPRKSPPSLPRAVQQAPVPSTQSQHHPPVVHSYSVSKKAQPPTQSYPKSSSRPEVAHRAGITPGEYGRLAIIIDDMGSNIQEARSLANIGVPLTFSIIPGLRNYREVSEFAASNGIETMIHIPMQSKGWPNRRLESNGLLVSMDDAEIGSRLEEFMRILPRAAGANNHMGSEFTEHEDKMRVVLDAMKGKGLYFVDSVTSPRSAGVQVARELGIKAGRRSVFLDNEQNSAYITGQINQAVRMAKKMGGVIVICHPHHVTIHTLEAVLPGLEKQGITLVSASQIVR